MGNYWKEAEKYRLYWRQQRLVMAGSMDVKTTKLPGVLVLKPGGLPTYGATSSRPTTRRRGRFAPCFTDLWANGLPRTSARRVVSRFSCRVASLTASARSKPNTEVAYQVDSYYAPASESGIIWNDPSLNIPWPVGGNEAILSEKNRQLGTFKDLMSPFRYARHAHA